MKTATVYTETVVHAAPEQFVADAPYQLAILVGADENRQLIRRFSWAPTARAQRCGLPESVWQSGIA